jgi:methionine synthase I (cobalamin-dependent)
MPSLEALLHTPPVLFEGAMGTMLMQHGLTAGQPGEIFTLERPEVLAEVHQAYVAAGARVLKTNTFNANPTRLAQSGLEGQLDVLNTRAVQIAREAAGANCAVAGSIGPTGGMFEPGGDLTHDAAMAAYAAQAEILHRAGVDLFVIETMFDRREALAAIDACRRVSDIPVVATMTFMDTPRGFFTIMGDPLVESLTELQQAGAIVVGANCTLTSAAMVKLAGALHAHLNGPLLMQPNAGMPQASGVTLAYPETPAEFAANLQRLAALRIDLLGGCCGTTPVHIAAACAALKQVR